MFSLDKLYITRNLRYNQLKSEGWLFFELSGAYNIYNTHKEAYKHFCNAVERIKCHQIREEFTPDSQISNNDRNIDDNEFSIITDGKQLEYERNRRLTNKQVGEQGGEQVNELDIIQVGEPTGVQVNNNNITEV